MDRSYNSNFAVVKNHATCDMSLTKNGKFLNENAYSRVNDAFMSFARTIVIFVLFRHENKHNDSENQPCCITHRLLLSFCYVEVLLITASLSRTST